jgi:hypothetical protein
LCDNLPHTPVAAIGLNYVFIHDHPDRDLDDKFELQDGLDELGEIVRTEITSLVRKDGRNINVKRSITTDELSCDFNFHFDVSNIRQLSSAVHDNPIDLCMGVAMDLYRNLYALEVNATRSLFDDVETVMRGEQ